ncbi:MAG TPA: NrfD/PsrC family molybdoenzyme membrane anchor subunit [Thermoanaerobaculia bacterium]
MSEAQLIDPRQDNASITEDITSIALRRHAPIWWFLGILGALGLAGALLLSAAYLLVRGVGIWGINIPVAWGFAITNFVWWIGIGHAGTLISAFLLLMHQKWRDSINRFAEAMTIFAVLNAGLFPMLHLGRPWVFYWLAPYPDTMKLWPQFRSPLVWDFVAVTAYLVVSLIFWYMGMIPDLATLRDRARSRIRKYAYAILALGWRGDIEHWERYEKTYLLLAGLATPLVVSVHSVVSFDFAVGNLPGWHSTIYPPYFVAGAMFSGLAMALTIGIPLRALFNLDDFITERHLDNMAKVMLTAGLIVAYGYLNEFFLAWYSSNLYERFHALNEIAGGYAAVFAIMMVANVALPQLLWLRKFRTSPLLLFAISVVINVGMWSERFVIIVGSLHRDFLPSSWHMFYPTIWDWATFAGTIGVFGVLLFLFIRFLPVVSMSEVRKLAHEERA